MSASLQRTVSAGTHYLRVRGTGYGNPLDTGYSSYGSRGGFSVRVS
jgi:hypothetical protein